MLPYATRSTKSRSEYVSGEYEYLPGIGGVVLLFLVDRISIHHISGVINRNISQMCGSVFVQFVDRFNALVDERNFSSYKIGKELNITDSLVGYWRKGERQPAMDNLIRLADYFDVSIDYLVGRTDRPEVNR